MRFTPFLHEARGAVAVEFTFVVPVMLALLFGGYEASRMANAFMRLNDSAEMMADLVSRQKSITGSQIKDFCSGIEIVMKPFSTFGYSATIASVTRSTSGAVVDWQDTSCGGGPSITSAATLALPYVPMLNDSVIVVQVSYAYHPLVSNAVAPSVSIVKRGYSRTRGGVSVAHD